MAHKLQGGVARLSQPFPYLPLRQGRAVHAAIAPRLLTLQCRPQRYLSTPETLDRTPRSPC